MSNSQLCSDAHTNTEVLLGDCEIQMRKNIVKVIMSRAVLHLRDERWRRDDCVITKLSTASESISAALNA